MVAAEALLGRATDQSESGMEIDTGFGPSGGSYAEIDREVQDHVKENTPLNPGAADVAQF